MACRRKFIQIGLVLALLLSLFSSSTAPQLGSVHKLQPQLAALAAQTPTQMVKVIVQKATASNAAEALVAQLGGVVTKDLSIINAFAANLRAQALQQLAGSAAVRWVSLDAPMLKSSGPDGPVNTANLLNVYNRAIRADQLWAQGYQGSSVTVAVIDSGMDIHSDFWDNSLRIKARTVYCSSTWCGMDFFGHGTHVGGIIGGNGAAAQGKYIGVAPKVNLLDVQISNDQGQATASDVVRGLQWVLNNKDTLKIRVVNLSLNSAVAESYHTSPLNAAVEILWFNRIVVVASAGNNGGGGVLYPPANDPFVITVGAVDDKGTVSISDDTVATFSAYGVTAGTVVKPDLVAPGRNIIAPRAGGNTVLTALYPGNNVGSSYFRMSGTSMAAPMVTGAIALLLQDEPNLTPDQVKFRLKATANKNWAGYNAAKAGAGYLDIFAAVNGATTQSANAGIAASQLLWTGSQPVTWGSVSWNSVSWNSVSWNSVSWNSVSWNSVSWNSDYWGDAVRSSAVVDNAEGAADLAIPTSAEETASELAANEQPVNQVHLLYLPVATR